MMEGFLKFEFHVDFEAQDCLSLLFTPNNTCLFAGKSIPASSLFPARVFMNALAICFTLLFHSIPNIRLINVLKCY